MRRAVAPAGVLAVVVFLSIALAGCQAEAPKPPTVGTPSATRPAASTPAATPNGPAVGSAALAPSKADSTAAATAAGGNGMKKVDLTTTVWKPGQRIPTKYTGEGDDVSPPLEWSNLPEGTQELAVICDDPDAPTPEPWVHWVIYKIPPTAKGLSEGVAKTAKPKEPAGALQGKNSWPTVGYRGPMPPPGHGTHHYYFRVYALDAPLSVQPGLDKKELLDAIAGRIVGQGELVGTYSR